MPEPSRLRKPSPPRHLSLSKATINRVLRDRDWRRSFVGRKAILGLVASSIAATCAIAGQWFVVPVALLLVADATLDAYEAHHGIGRWSP